MVGSVCGGEGGTGQCEIFGFLGKGLGGGMGGTLPDRGVEIIVLLWWDESLNQWNEKR